MPIISDGNNRSGDELTDKHTTIGTTEHTGSYVLSGSAGSVLNVKEGLLFVTSSDKMGVGTTSPSAKIHVVGTSKLQGNTFVTGSFNVTGSAQIKSDSLVNQKAIKLDGLTPFDEVSISDDTTATSFSSGGGNDKPFTISMWVNLDEIDFDGTTSLNLGGLYTKRSSSPNNGEIYIGASSGYLALVLYADPEQNGVGSFSTSNRIVVSGGSGNFRFFHAENTWFHVCITYDGTKELSGIRIYKNSHPVGTSTIMDGDDHSTANPDLNVPNQVFFGTMAKTNYSGMPRTSIPTTLGGIDVNDSTSTAIAGKLADVCRFNRVLTHAEVQEIYNGGKVKNMEEHSAYSDLVHWWKMGDHIDTIGQDGIKDYVGGYHGTLGGDASIVPETSLGSDVVSTWSVNRSGSLGVGTSKPSLPFHVVGSSKIEGDLELISGNTTVKSFNRLKTKSISFDGTDDYIEISDHDDFTFSDGSSDKPFSIQAWLKIEDTATDEGSILSKYDANTAAEWLFWQDNGVIRLNLYDSSQATPTTKSIKLTGNSASLTNDTWHHVVVTYDGSENHSGLKAYVDGALISSTTELTNTYTGMINTTVPVQIGGTHAGTIDFEKRIGSVAVFTKELTAAEVLELYNNGKVMNLEYHSAYSKILSWWKMGDDLDTTGTDGIKDYVNSHHGTLNGNASIVDESDLPSEFLESFRINTAGNVGIGTTTPNSKLDINGNTIVTGSIKSTILGSRNETMIVGSDNVLSSSNLLTIDTDNQKVGIGTTTPDSKLHVGSTSTDVLLTLETTEASSTASPVLKMKRNSSSPADADYLGQIKFAGENDADQEINYVKMTGKIEDASDGNEDGILEFANIKAGSQTITARLRSDSLQLLNSTNLTVDGSIGIGTNTPDDALDVTGNVRISNYLRLNCDGTTDPSGTPPLTNHAHIYSKLVSGHAEIFVQDSNGNVTQISPHTPEGEWQYFSRNTRTGKVVKVNMEKMIRRLEEITGESFMEEWYEDLTE